MTWPIIASCFLLSGFAGLLYQTTWMRQFGIVFGTAESAVVATLAAYMAGLGLGSWLAGRFATHIRRPLTAYVVLELGIGASALAVPWLIIGLKQLLSAAVASGVLDLQAISLNLLAIYMLGTFLVLMLPTTLMGATLPVLLRFVVTRDQQIGARTSVLYGINTLGAVFGTVVTAFLLLPSLPLSTIVLLGAAINVLAAAGAFFLRNAYRESPGYPSSVQGIRNGSTTHVILLAMFASGFASFSLEVTWTRLLGHVAGGSIYAFAVMLATFLTGIALGSIAAQRLCRTRDVARISLAWMQVGISAFSLLTYMSLGQLVPEGRSWAAILLFSAAVMLPVTLLIGATFPLAVRASVEHPDATPSAAGRIYAVNTLGAIIGAFAAGFVLLPELGFSGTVKLVSAIGAVIALLIFTFPITNRAGPAVALVTLVAATLIPLTRPDSVIGTSTINGTLIKGEEIFYSVGRSATVFAKRFNGFINLRTNGLPEASIATKGSPPVRNSQQWLGTLPLLAAPDARSFLVVGLGGGVALEALPAEPDVEVTVVEIESQVLAANQQFEDQRRIPVLDRENVNVVINDARSTLSLNNQTYDVIISQPSHPWTAGASHLYTQEFIELAKQRLNPDGVLLQWINAAFLDEELLRSVVATLTSQFKSVLLFHPAPGELEFLASDRQLEAAFHPTALALTLKDRNVTFGDLGIQSPLDVLGSLALSDRGTRRLAGDAIPNSDNLNRLATRSKSRGNGLSIGDITRITADKDALCGGNEFKPYQLNTDEQFYVHRLWLLSGFPDRAAACLKMQQPAVQRLTAAYAMLLQGNQEKAVELLEISLQDNESREAAAYLLKKLELLDNTSIDQEVRAAPAGQASSSTLTAWKAAQSGQWEIVEASDRALAQSAPRDIWYQDAAKLMSEWRIRKAISTGDPDYLRIALAIIDTALSAQWTEDILILRTGIGALLKDPQLYLSSVNGYLNLIDLRNENDFDRELVKPLDAITQRRLAGILNQLDADWLKGNDISEEQIRSRIAELSL